MDFAAGAEAEALRAEVRAFVREHLTADVLGRVAATGDYHDREFHAALAGRGWVGAHWHVEDGGRGWDRAMTDIIYEELASAGAPTEGLAITQIVGRPSGASAPRSSGGGCSRRSAGGSCCSPSATPSPARGPTWPRSGPGRPATAPGG